MKRILVCFAMFALVGCSLVQSSPSEQDNAMRAAAAVKVALTGAYQTSADLLQAGVLSLNDAKSIYVNLSRAESALATAQLHIATDPLAAQAYINTALTITTQILADLQSKQRSAGGAP